MTIKDYKIGQEVFIMLSRRQGWQLDEEKDLIKCVVEKVGSKYVYAKPNNRCYSEKFFQQDEKDDFLMEYKDYGDRKLLFSTKEAAFDYVEKRRIFDGLQYMFHYSVDYDRFTLEQLREVQKILNT